MTIDQWLLKFDPANFSFSVLVFILLVSALLFVWLKWWPWYTHEAWPARQRAEIMHMEIEARQEQSRIDVMSSIRDALVELKVIVSQNNAATNRVLEHLDQLATLSIPPAVAKSHRSRGIDSNGKE